MSFSEGVHSPPAGVLEKSKSTTGSQESLRDFSSPWSYHVNFVDFPYLKYKFSQFQLRTHVGGGEDPCVSGEI
ncbi:unnamed protein product [Pleuronectes platessa]|uniref:Uncharacterized protein n=1 Tax=Pleuronectes platessa TaxID=8262 RepID=A0A9N7TVC3_PLEPL|nr:unnamed protein product [Pleuronectes platessa]